jgi:hypothetical protein
MSKLICCAFAGAMIAGAGCATSASAPANGYGVWEFTGSEYTGVTAATVDRTWKATLAALDQLGFKVAAKDREATSGLIRATAPDDTSVEIVLERRSSGDFTRVGVRFGVFGDEARSKALVAKIKENL